QIALSSFGVSPWQQNAGFFANPWELHRGFGPFDRHAYDRGFFGPNHHAGFANHGVDHGFGRFSHLADRTPFARGEHDFWQGGAHGFGPDAWDGGFGFGDDRGPHYGRGPKGYKRPDERIREEVCEVISRQGFIDATDVEVIVESGVVRLVGSVGQRREKRGLEQLIERVHGVEEVRNELRLNRDASVDRFQSRIAAERQAAQPHNGKNARA
ncbi:MAG: BON domain-containing protein, partial [Labilithrix sp.]|nr:BON domain-containing protein [Labilithrix sp.]